MNSAFFKRQRTAGEQLKLQENFTPTAVFFNTKEEKEEEDDVDLVFVFLHFISLAKLGFVSSDVRGLFSPRVKVSRVACLVRWREEE